MSFENYQRGVSRARGNCFRPSASLTVVLGICGQGLWRLAAMGTEEQGNRGYKGIRFEAKAKLKGYVAGNGEAD